MTQPPPTLERSPAVLADIARVAVLVKARTTFLDDSLLPVRKLSDGEVVDEATLKKDENLIVKCQKDGTRFICPRVALGYGLEEFSKLLCDTIEADTTEVVIPERIDALTMECVLKFCILYMKNKANYPVVDKPMQKPFKDYVKDCDWLNKYVYDDLMIGVNVDPNGGSWNNCYVIGYADNHQLFKVLYVANFYQMEPLVFLIVNIMTDTVRGKSDELVFDIWHGKQMTPEEIEFHGRRIHNEGHCQFDKTCKFYDGPKDEPESTKEAAPAKAE